MDEKRRTKISKFLSLILRHQPEIVGLKLENDGWVEVEKLIAACATSGKPLSLDELREVVETNDKKRFAFDENEIRIRANQGHSVAVKIEFEQKTPPEILYHGTAAKNGDLILADGLKKMARHHVHLSTDIETARKVGARHGKPIIFAIVTSAMIDAGVEFFVSTNNVWLVDSVAPRFLRLIEHETN